MTARIYVFRRRDGKIFTDAVNRLTDLGYKLQCTPKGNVEAIPAEEWCVCPECNGTGSRAMLDERGMYVICLSCDGRGLY